MCGLSSLRLEKSPKHFESLVGKSAYEFALARIPERKRFLFDSFYKAAFDSGVNKVLALYGLRRTGKTTILLQSIKDLYESGMTDIAYIYPLKETFCSYLHSEMSALRERGVKVFIIDEITRLADFSKNSAFLQDIFVQGGCCVAIAGTDSLMMQAVASSALYDRVICVHTTIIPFKEYHHLTGEPVKQYLLRGGLLRQQTKEATGLFDYKDNMKYPNDNGVQTYVDSAIVSNIEMSMKKAPNYLFASVKKLVDNGYLTPILHNMLQTDERSFIPHITNAGSDIGSAIELYSKGFEKLKNYTAISVDDVINAITQVHYSMSYNTDVPVVDDNTARELLELLEVLDLIVPGVQYVVHSNGELECKKHWVCTIPCLRNSQYSIAVRALKTDPFVSTLNQNERDRLFKKVMGNRLGHLLEEQITAETANLCRVSNLEVFKIKFERIDAEIDMVVYNRDTRELDLFEIKNSTVENEMQVKWLNNEEVSGYLTEYFGTIKSKTVLYNGDNGEFFGVKYKNAMEYLCELKAPIIATR